MDVKYGLAIPAIAGLGLSLGGCSQTGDVLTDGASPLVGNWSLDSVVSSHPSGQEVSYLYPSVRHYADCTNTVSAKLIIDDLPKARLRVRDHYHCMGEAENDVMTFYDFEVETLESGRRWYLYYLFDHTHPPFDDQDDDAQGTPIPERELWYTCTAEDSELTCEVMTLEPGEHQHLFFTYDPPDDDE